MVEEKFSSPSNRVLGGIGAALGLAVVVAILVDGPDKSGIGVIFAIALGLVLVWAYLIRPEIRLSETTLSLLNPLVTVAIPLQLVMRVDVRRFTVVELDEGGFTSPAVSRMAIQIARADRGAKVADTGEFMLARIRARLDESARVPLPEGAEVRRTPARVELALMAVAALGLVVTLLL